VHTQWFHNYSTIGNNLGLTALVVSIPIFFLFWALSFKRMAGHVAGILTLLLTILITTVTYRMPVSTAISAAVLGMLNGLLQVGWIILSALFLYNITVESGQLEILKGSISLLSIDRRLQAILIAFCFSAFMEGTTGMGAPAAVCAAMLIGIGFPPLPAALTCLAGNTQSVPFGTVGVPTIMMTSVTGISDHVLGRAVGNDVVVMALIIPVVIAVVLAGWRSAMGVMPAALIAGGTYGVTCFVVIRFMGVELPSILSSFVSMASLIAFLKVWQPKSTWRFFSDPDSEIETTVIYTTGRVMKAWGSFHYSDGCDVRLELTCI
jgi:lactate permease